MPVCNSRLRESKLHCVDSHSIYRKSLQRFQGAFWSWQKNPAQIYIGCEKNFNDRIHHGFLLFFWHLLSEQYRCCDAEVLPASDYSHFFRSDEFFQRCIFPHFWRIKPTVWRIHPDLKLTFSSSSFFFAFGHEKSILIDFALRSAGWTVVGSTPRRLTRGAS